MKAKWTFAEKGNAREITQLSKAINVNTHLAALLHQRGIKTFEAAKDYFRPDLDELHDPFLMLGMDKAVNRLTEAISKNEKIMIYGDYDVDGTTSVSLMYLFLKKFSDQFIIYIPDRYSEGYGISRQGINHAISQKVTLMIALDCGIRAINQTKLANEAGIDLIICDHHNPAKQVPDAYAILNPKQKNCAYPFKELSGCGVGFKLLQGFCRQNTIELEVLFEWLDLVMVSIASDIVPIVGENRILAYHGLQKLNKNPSAGLKSLIEISGKKPPISISDVVFYIGPRINAAGRLAHAHDSVKLLIGEKLEANKDQAKLLNQQNQDRKEYDKSITAEALEMIAKDAPDKKTTVLFKPDWHKGVVGIVASRCTEYYYRPTIILTDSGNGMATGSARSVKEFDVCAAISQCDQWLEKYGGHKYAAGLSLKQENIEPFKKQFEEVVAASITPEMLTPKLKIDLEVPLSFVSFKVANIIQQMSPFGPQNMTPVFCTKNLSLQRIPKVIKGAHIKGKVTDDNFTFEFIAFNMAEDFNKLEKDAVFDMVYQIEINEFRGMKSLVLNVKAISF